jgi:hypothetical protein
MFVKDTLLIQYNCHILDSTIEGLLIIELKHKISNFTVCLYIVYLPPERSNRGRDADTFFNLLLSKVYLYTQSDLSLILGDFNGRIGTKDDFVKDIDDVVERFSIDDISNKHGDCLIEFCKDSKFVILNGRVTPNYDNYTCISYKGKSVVDYILCPQAEVIHCKNFIVSPVKRIIEQFNLTPPEGSTEGNVPDHSIVCAFVDVHYSGGFNVCQNHGTNRFRYDMNHIPDTFMNNNIIAEMVNRTCIQVDICPHSQQDIDHLYSSICTIYYSEMNDKLLKSDNRRCQKKGTKRKPKPWWCEELSVLWKDLCKAEKLYLAENRNRQLRQNLRETFNMKQNIFDRTYRRIKRNYEKDQIANLKLLQTSDPKKFWSELKRLGPQRKDVIPCEVVLENGSVCTNFQIVLEEWHNAFKTLYQCSNFENCEFDNELFDKVKLLKDSMENGQCDTPFAFRHELLGDVINDEITKSEIETVIKNAKNGKAYGIDKLPNEVFKNELSVLLIHKLLHLCFESGISPSSWGRTIIKPIPKGSTSDTRNPRLYRGISLISCLGKLYSSVLNQRLSVFLEMLGGIVDEQNGFRSSRSCLEHLYTITSIVRNRQLQNLPTFCCFIDMAKAFDSVDRDCLFYKLLYNGITGKLYRALVSLYSNQACAVKINDSLTDWFINNIGVRQGDPLSPTLFSLFINDLAIELKNLNIGVKFGDDIINILLYADDIVIMAENEHALQSMIDKCCDWCSQWRIRMNIGKTKVVHFRKQSIPRSDFSFRCFNEDLLVADKYNYLGMILDEHLNFKITANVLSDSASRAFGFVISKLRNFKCLDYQLYDKLIITCIHPIMDYASGVWGFKQYDHVSAIENKFMRYFLGVHRFAPNLGLWGDMGWIPSVIRRKVNIVRLWCRLIRTDEIRIVKKVFLTDLENCKLLNFKNWVWEVKQIFDDTGQLHLFDSETRSFSLTAVLQQTKDKLMEKYKANWTDTIVDFPKLRTYVSFKHDYVVENYVKCFLTRSERSFIAQFRLGILPLHIETGRFTAPITLLEDRICKNCELNEVEDERHFLLHCTLYTDERNVFYDYCSRTIENFFTLNANEKFVNILGCESACKQLAKFIMTCYKKRKM